MRWLTRRSQQFDRAEGPETGTATVIDSRPQYLRMETELLFSHHVSSSRLVTLRIQLDDGREPYDVIRVVRDPADVVILRVGASVRVVVAGDDPTDLVIDCNAMFVDTVET